MIQKQEPLRFRILRASHLDGLEALVNLYIHRGWYPHGSMQLHGTYLIQPMYFPKENCK